MTPDIDQAVKQVRRSFGIARLDDLAVLEITGPDALRFLQNRLSNDVLSMKIGAGQLNAALDRQGKIQGVFSLYRQEDGLRMLIPRAEQENCIAQIEKFHIVEQFTVKKITNVVIISLQGPQSGSFLKSLLQTETTISLPEKEHSWVTLRISGQPVWILRRSFSGDAGFLLLAETEQPQTFWEDMQTAALSAQGVEMSAEVQEVLRVEAGIPRFGADYDFETLLPETGLERQAVSYSKGCYLGQETIARIKTYGMVQKALVGLLFEHALRQEELPPAGSECLLDGKTVGTLKSGVFSPTLERAVAFAYLGKSERVPGKKLTLSIGGKLFPVEVALLPFYEGGAHDQSGRQLLGEGLKLFADGFDEAAMRALRRAIEVEPGLIEAYEALGVILSRHEQFKEAIEMMERVLALEPEHVLAHTNLSVFYMKLGDKEKAEEEKAKATMAAFSKKAKESGLAMPDFEAERRKKEQATLERIEMFREALKFNPEDPLGNFGLGSALLELKRFGEAIEPFEKTLKAQPKHSVAYLSLGKSLEGAGEFQKAQNVYQNGIEVAAAKGDLMPLKELQARLESLTLKLQGNPG